MKIDSQRWFRLYRIWSKQSNV